MHTKIYDLMPTFTREQSQTKINVVAIKASTYAF